MYRLGEGEGREAGEGGKGKDDNRPVVDARTMDMDVKDLSQQTVAEAEITTDSVAEAAEDLSQRKAAGEGNTAGSVAEQVVDVQVEGEETRTRAGTRMRPM